MVAEMAKAKDLFIHHLTQLFDGDDLAAQSVLLNLTTPLTHRHPLPNNQSPNNLPPIRPPRPLNPTLRNRPPQQDTPVPPLRR
jgi:hypothetical protein